MLLHAGGKADDGFYACRDNCATGSFLRGLGETAENVTGSKPLEANGRPDEGGQEAVDAPVTPLPEGSLTHPGPSRHAHNLRS